MSADEQQEEGQAPEPGTDPLEEAAEQEDAETDEPGPADDDAPDTTGDADDAETGERTDDGTTSSQPEASAALAPQSVTPEQHDIRVAKLGKSYANYGRRFEELFEADSDDYFACPLCAGETPGFLNKGSMGRFPEQQADLVKRVLGLARPVELKQSSKHRRCPECDGKGKVKTDSDVPGQEAIVCEDCTGHGYVGPARSAPLAASNGSEGVTGPTVYTEPTAPADKDEWDQPRLLPNGHENPNFGRMPNHWIQVEPWGDTRGLTAQDAVRSGG